MTFRNELPDLSTLATLRSLGSTSGNYCELHGFGDAAKKAIGAVVYLRVSPPSNLTRLTLVTPKAKKARLKETSIPRLELCAADLLVRLASHVRSVFSLSSSTPIHLWSDSENTLDWIRGHPLRWKTYISNRISEIQRVLPEAFWHHVPVVDNTAIDPSVGREERVTTHSALVDQETPWRLLTQYSSLTKLLRITTLCMQFVDRFRRKQFQRPPCHPTKAYLKKAQKGLIGHVQRQAFSEDVIKLQRKLPISKSSPSLKLLPFLDSDGLLRLGGRLNHAVLDYEERCPCILPKDSLLTTLIDRNGHQSMLHGGPQLTLSYLRRKYWILSGRTDVKRVLARCVVCARHWANPCNQVMSPLPNFRDTPPVRPFAAAGLNYAGPIWMRTTKGRGHKACKRYIAIFVCCATRALHLEAVSDYTTHGFIAAYKRFSVRRGVSHTFYSDNGTTFIGADRQLRELFSKASAVSDKVARYLADNHTTWKLKPPAASHFGVLWEAEPTLVNERLTPRERWQLLPQMYQSFWKIWSSEYLHELQARHKWHKPTPPVKNGDLVLVLQEKIPPTKWPLARVIRVHPGANGHVRSVTVKTATGLSQRPVVKIVSLPVSVSDSTDAVPLQL